MQLPAATPHLPPCGNRSGASQVFLWRSPVAHEGYQWILLGGAVGILNGCNYGYTAIPCYTHFRIPSGTAPPVWVQEMPYILVAACYFLVGTRLPQVAACMGSTAFDPGSVHRFIQNGTGRCHQDIFGGDIPYPSGKLLHNYGKSPFLMGKLTISMAILTIAFCMFTRPGIWSEEILQVTSDPSLAG